MDISVTCILIILYDFHTMKFLSIQNIKLYSHPKSTNKQIISSSNIYVADECVLVCVRMKEGLAIISHRTLTLILTLIQTFIVKTIIRR